MAELKKSRRFRDLTGMQFNHWNVLEYAGPVLTKSGEATHNSKWTCQCSCGKIKDIPGCNLTTGKSKSCGCVVERYDDLHGRIVDDITVIGYPIKSRNATPRGQKYTKVSWVVACRCGSIKRILSSFIKKKNAQHSCSYGPCQRSPTSQETIDKNVRKFLSEEAKEAGIPLNKYLSQWN